VHYIEGLWTPNGWKGRNLLMAKRRTSSPKSKTGVGKAAVRWIGGAEATRAGVDRGSKLVKRLAAKQKFKVKLTASQMKAIQSQLKRWDNTRPAELTFLVRGELQSRFRVAAYAYRGDTCCA
jgi:hypothetical protein